MTPGTIGWVDITVGDAETMRDFYRAVAGWSVQKVSMGEYDDYTMLDSAGNPAAGVCHSRGANASLPPGWLMYIVVENLDESLAQCRALGGEVVRGPLEMGSARYAIIRDPSGAHAALYMP